MVDADPGQQYTAMRETLAGLVREDRIILEVRGSDRAAWFHNLCTNEVKNLQPGEGNYFFATDVKGQILFDGNVLCCEEYLLIDIDSRYEESALQHLNKYIIMEDVTVAVADLARLTFVGPESPAVPESFGVTNLVPMSQLQHVSLSPNGEEPPSRIVRHDWAGIMGCDVIASPKGIKAIDRKFIETNITRTTIDQVNVIRIEQGIPWSGSEISSDVRPAETRQIERAVSFQKGCYLGQEIVERMRAHDSVARVLVGMLVTGEVSVGDELSHDGSSVGRITSVTYSPLKSGTIALGYVKTKLAAPSTQLQAGSATCEICPTPFE